MTTSAASLFGPVAQDMARVEERLRKAVAADGEPMAGPMGDLFGAGGKRIRPALVLLAGYLGRYDFELLAPAAMAVELTHAATLVHDDVIDGSKLRRGRPTVAAVLGDESAIVIGDHHFAKAYAQASLTGRHEVVHELATAVMRICRGELRQQSFRYRYRVGVEEYLARIEAKTAALLAASAWIGGHLGQLGTAGEDALRRYGIALGLAFQIVDDVLDYLGDAAEVGKPVGVDLLEGHATLPLMFALEEDQALAARLEEGSAVAAGDVAQLVERVRASAGPRRALAEAERHAEEARRQLDALPAGDARGCLAAFADYVVSRTR